MKHLNILGLAAIILFVSSACNRHSSTQEVQPPKVSVKTIPVREGNIEKKITLNGKTIFLKKNTLVSPIPGYIVKINVKYGDAVQKDEVLFEIQTKESKTLKNTGIFSSTAGIIQVRASFSGVVNNLNINETGGYITEGSPLCSMVVTTDLRVQVNVPFEYHSQIKPGSKCILLLSDHTSIPGTVLQILPFMDAVNQTQHVLIKPASNRALPEDLNLLVQFITDRHQSVLLVPPQAVMTNEIQSEFWVMKIENDSLAVKVPIKKGIENDSIIEILSAELKKNDRVIREGAYGLPDRTIVKIIR